MIEIGKVKFKDYVEKNGVPRGLDREDIAKHFFDLSQYYVSKLEARVNFLEEKNKQQWHRMQEMNQDVIDIKSQKNEKNRKITKLKKEIEKLNELLKSKLKEWIFDAINNNENT